MVSPEWKHTFGLLKLLRGHKGLHSNEVLRGEGEG